MKHQDSNASDYPVPTQILSLSAFYQMRKPSMRVHALTHVWREAGLGRWSTTDSMWPHSARHLLRNNKHYRNLCTPTPSGWSSSLLLGPSRDRWKPLHLPRNQPEVTKARLLDGPWGWPLQSPHLPRACACGEGLELKAGREQRQGISRNVP